MTFQPRRLVSDVVTDRPEQCEQTITLNRGGDMRLECDPKSYRGKLRGCPWCGHVPEMVRWHGGRPGKRLISCVNDACYTQPSCTGETPAIAAARWNSSGGTRFVP
jgi:hypothetical protein